MKSFITPHLSLFLLLLLNIIKNIHSLQQQQQYNIKQKLYSCNEKTGFCDLLSLNLTSSTSSPTVTSQEKCLLTCQGTIWPAPLVIEEMVTGSTTDFCGIEFVFYGEDEYERMAMENFLKSLGRGEKDVLVCDEGEEKTLSIVMKSLVSSIIYLLPYLLDTFVISTPP